MASAANENFADSLLSTLLTTSLKLHKRNGKPGKQKPLNTWIANVETKKMAMSLLRFSIANTKRDTTGLEYICQEKTLVVVVIHQN